MMSPHELRIGQKLKACCLRYLADEIDARELQAGISGLTSALDSTQPKEFISASFEFIELDMEDVLALETIEEQRTAGKSAIRKFLAAAQRYGFLEDEQEVQ